MTNTPIHEGLLARIAQAARYAVQGTVPAAWFGPDTPLAPMAPEGVAGRRFDYPTGYNTNTTPRAQDPVSFADLRALADNCDILRSVIETRKDQIEAQNWTVRVIPAGAGGKRMLPTDDQKRRIDTVLAFLQCPDKEHSFEQWIRQILEDMFVIDAATLYKRRTRSGGLYALEVIDGATIKILLDDGGRLPMAPEPAYQQILKGVPAVDYTREELWYMKHNPRSHKVYGYSHVEQVLVTVNILIRRALHQLEYYRDGSQPDAFIGLPKEWNQEQIVAFQKHFDAMLSGNLAMRRRLRFMPGDFSYKETKAPPLKDAYDEYLARVICFVFSISPEPFVGMMNRATAQTSHARSTDEGLAPLQRYLKSMLNRLIASEFASPDLEFVWQDAREQDPKDAASVDVAYVNAGIMTVNEVRQGLGLGPIAATTTAQKKTLAGLGKFNLHHVPAGRPDGGQFTTPTGAGGAGDGSMLDDLVDDVSVSDIVGAIADGMDGAGDLFDDDDDVDMAADDGVQSDATPETWGNPDTLQKHFDDHKAGLGIDTEEEYVYKANEFLNKSLNGEYQMKVEPEGYMRVYDDSTNTFGSYNPDGTTRTFFKPKTTDYFDQQPGKIVQIKSSISAGGFGAGGEATSDLFDSPEKSLGRKIYEQQE